MAEEHNITKNCDNCHAKIDDTSMCMTCGFEYEDNNIYIEESYKSKYSYSFYGRIRNHNPNKYCESWLLQLQGKETVNISSENFNKLLDLAKIWFSNNKELSCAVIRKWLKSLSLTIYNSHITWLRKEIESACDIEGYSYELTSNEVSDILEQLNKIIDLYPKIMQEAKILKLFKRGKVQNNLYYPYFIVRILTLVIHDKNRLATLLSNIHFQSRTILTRNEHIWKEVCKQFQYEYSPLESS